MVMSSPLAGAEITTFLAPPTRWPLGLLGLGEKAGGLDDDLNADRGPGKLGGVLLGEHLDEAAVDPEVAADGLDRSRIRPERRVVFEQVRVHFRVRQIVDRDDLDVGIVEGGAQNETPDASETVDADFNGHDESSGPR